MGIFNKTFEEEIAAKMEKIKGLMYTCRELGKQIRKYGKQNLVLLTMKDDDFLDGMNSGQFDKRAVNLVIARRKCLKETMKLEEEMQQLIEAARKQGYKINWMGVINIVDPSPEGSVLEAIQDYAEKSLRA